MWHKTLLIRELAKHEDIPYDLLLLADPSREIIESYLKNANIYIAQLQDKILGVYVLVPIDSKIIEIKNIAVDSNFHGQGLGKLLLQDASNNAIEKGFKSISIGTANSSIGQLYLYQQQGFEITNIKKNFFLENYKDPIYENGLQCKHMIILSKQL